MRYGDILFNRLLRLYVICYSIKFCDCFRQQSKEYNIAMKCGDFCDFGDFVYLAHSFGHFLVYVWHPIFILLFGSDSIVPYILEISGNTNGMM